MKSSFMLPSCTYNIYLSPDDLNQLLTTGRVSVDPLRNFPCRTGRAVYDVEKQTFKTLDGKHIPNNLRFYLNENVADIEGGDWHIQFLNIMIEGVSKRRKQNDRTER